MSFSRSVTAPRIDPLVLGSLSDAKLDVLEQGADLDSLRFTGVRAPRVNLGGSTVMGCEFQDVWVTEEFGVATSSLVEVRFRQLGAPLVRLARSSMREVEFDGGRLGAVEAYDVQCRAVRFSSCRVNYLNLRGAQLFDVEFDNCHIDELDLVHATAQRVHFTQCRVGDLSLHGGTFTDVDLRGAELAGVDGPASLRGVTISAEQLALLAPQLADELGILVLD